MKSFFEIFTPPNAFSDRKNHFKRVVLLFILFPFFIFYLQQFKPYFKLKPLSGYFIPNSTYVSLNVNGWFAGEYQKTTDNYLNENFGFRSFFVRLNNQIRFLLFNKAQAEGVVVGKENYLYELDYIESYYGKNFLGEKAIKDTVSNIKFLQDTLKALGKELLIVIAPSKARVYPEFIPESYKVDGKQKTNYDFFCKEFIQQGIQFIDFNSLFLQKKKNSVANLYPKLGIHWSRLESLRATDSILKYLANISKTQLPQLKIGELIASDELQVPDNDIIEGMNILSYPDFPKMKYPIKVDIDVANKEKKNIIVVSDSYWWDIYGRGIPKNVFNENEFWYYNNELHGNHYMGKTNPKNIDIKRHILRSDYIILMCTECGLRRIGFGFIGNSIKSLKTPISPTKNEVKAIKELITTKPDWYLQVKEKAAKLNLPLDSMLTRDANWYFQRKGALFPEVSIADIKASIEINPDWINQVKQKAKERNISLDSMLTIDAYWYSINVLHNEPKENKNDLTIEMVKKLILKNKEWLDDIKKKAPTRGISIDSMMTLDALWYMQQTSK